MRMLVQYTKWNKMDYSIFAGYLHITDIKIDRYSKHVRRSGNQDILWIRIASKVAKKS